MSSVSTAARLALAVPAREGASGRAEALGVSDDGTRRERDDPLPRDELDQIAPMRADVGECPRGAPEGGVDAPVVVLGREQPVLEVAAVQQPQLAERAFADAGTGLAHRRVVPVDEGHGRDPVGGRGGEDQLVGAGDVERERLLADEVLARLERGTSQRQVEVVRCADVDDVDLLAGDQLLRGCESALGAELLACGRGALGRRGHRSDDPRAGEPGRASVDPADEPDADDPHPQRRSTTGMLRRCSPLDCERASLLHRRRTYATYALLSSKSSRLYKLKFAMDPAQCGLLLA